MMDMPGDVIKKLKAEEVTGSYCVSSRSEAACRGALPKCQSSTTDPVNNVSPASASVNRVHTKREINNDAATSTSSTEQHYFIEEEEFIDIKHEEITCQDYNHSPYWTDDCTLGGACFAVSSVSSDPASNVYTTYAAVNEVNIGLVNVAVASTSTEQHEIIKGEESIDTKYKETTIQDENYNFNMGKDSSIDDPLTAMLSGSGVKKLKSGGSSMKSILQCSECDYETEHRGHLISHLRRHTGEKPFPCSQCDYRAAQMSHLERHMRTHTGDKPFECPECNYKATEQYDLKVHLRTHTGLKPFECSKCNYKAIQMSQIKLHMRSHTDDKPIQCSECNYKTAYMSNLTKHMRTHTGEKPFQCSKCFYKATHLTNLKSHMRTHTGDKPFECSECNYKSAHVTTLKRHKQTHTDLISLECSLCSYKASRKSSLTRHMQKHSSLPVASVPAVT